MLYKEPTISNLIINVGDLLYKDTAETIDVSVVADFTIPDPLFTSKAKTTGSIQIIKLEKNLWARYNLETSYSASCIRCLEPAHISTALKFDRYFAEQPQEDELPVTPDYNINLEPPILEEIILSLPIKPLCKPDCLGLCSECGTNLNQKTCKCSKTTSKDDRMVEIQKQLKKFKTKE